jgi:SAM-dependent methyltransferase
MDYLNISETLRTHYAETFSKHGPTLGGVDWSDSAEKEKLRMSKVLGVIREYDSAKGFSILDVGCGYGSALQPLKEKSENFTYVGIDLVAAMIVEAKKSYPNQRFICGDLLEETFAETFDYVICNGILTQKLSSQHSMMLEYMQQLVSKMFSICRIGISFNIMSLYSNYQVENLFYMNPQDVIEHVGRNLSSHFTIDQSYGLYEFTTYVYKKGEFE